MERDEFRPGMTLSAYAGAWVDMVPHLGHLMELASDAKTIVEFGVRGGVSTWAMLDAMADDAILVGVDINPECPIPPRVRDDPRFYFLVGDSRTVELPQHPDMVMIDSSHEYSQTVEELSRVAGLKPSVIAMHDYLYEETPGVRQAIEEFVADGPYYLEKVYPSHWGLAILRPR